MRNGLVFGALLLLMAGLASAVNYTYITPVNYTFSDMIIGTNYTYTFTIYTNTTNDTFINLTETETSPASNWTHCWANTTGWGFNNNHTNLAIAVTCRLGLGDGTQTIKLAGYSSGATNLTATITLSPHESSDSKYANVYEQTATTQPNGGNTGGAQQTAQQNAGLDPVVIGGVVFGLILIIGGGYYAATQGGKKRRR